MAKKSKTRKPVETIECRSVLQVEKTYPIAGKFSEGDLYDVNVFKVFPPVEPREGPFVEPEMHPLSTDFQEWFDYFVELIGATVEKLNAWQFNMGQQKPLPSGSHPLARKFAKKLDALAQAMGIGQKGSHNPRKLRWPLDGVYVCDLLLQLPKPTKRLPRGKRIDPTRVLLITSFESDPDYRVVTHCSVVLIEPSRKDKHKAAVLPPAVVNWDSSSSSSLGTGSSSSSISPSPRPIG
jgi:hypothetical protein